MLSDVEDVSLVSVIIIGNILPQKFLGRTRAKITYSCLEIFPETFQPPPEIKRVAQSPQKQLQAQFQQASAQQQQQQQQQQQHSSSSTSSTSQTMVQQTTTQQSSSVQMESKPAGEFQMDRFLSPKSLVMLELFSSYAQTY